jgi:hypothetical protein
MHPATIAPVFRRRIMRTKLFLPVLIAAIALCAPLLTGAGQTSAADAGTITCRVLEAHAGARPAVVAVVFHQTEKADQPRLAALLLQHSGEEAEVQIGAQTLDEVTVFRLKSCFGRGLLLLPANAPPLKDGATFILKFSEAGDKK